MTLPSPFRLIPLEVLPLVCKVSGLLIEKLFRKSALADHGAEGSDWNVFSRMRDDDGVGIVIPVFGVASPLGDEGEAIGSKNADESS